MELVGRELRGWKTRLASGRESAEGNSGLDTKVARDPAARRPAIAMTWDISDDVGNEPEDASEVIQQMARARGQGRAVVRRWGPHNREHD